MPPGYFSPDSNSTPWRKSSVAAGVEVKDLGTVNGRSMQLVRFAPGTKFPVHTHEGPEFVYMIEGEALQKRPDPGPGLGSRRRDRHPGR